MAKEKIQKNTKLETVLWDAACKLIGTVLPHDYMNVCLGLIFLKYVSDRYEARRKELLERPEEYDDPDDPDAYREENVFLVPECAKWSYISDNSKQTNIGQLLDTALLEIENSNPELKNILPKIYSKNEIDKRRLGELVDIFTNQLSTITIEGDVFGRCYEYFLGEFSKKFGQKGGEFYTPRSVVDLIVNMIEPYKGRVYDPCCGSGGMFTQSANFIREHQGNVDEISIYGQELNPDTWRLAKMNLAIRGINADLGNSCGDTFHDDKHKNVRFEYIMANPPFNISDYGQNLLQGDKRWIYGIPPAGNANYAWIQHMVSKLTEKGIAGFVLANGSLSTNIKEEFEIRKGLLERDGGIVDCIIALPANLFSTVSIPACLWFLRKGRSNTSKTLFIDCRDKGIMINRKIRELTYNDPSHGHLDDESLVEKVKNYNKESYGDESIGDICYIADTYHKWLKGDGYTDIKGFCKSVLLSEISKNNYSLVPGRYVGIDESEKQSKEEVEEEIRKIKRELKEHMQKAAMLDTKILEILNSDE
jgi:type I restriction enzyme M protein